MSTPVIVCGSALSAGGCAAPRVIGSAAAVLAGGRLSAVGDPDAFEALQVSAADDRALDACALGEDRDAVPQPEHRNVLHQQSLDVVIDLDPFLGIGNSAVAAQRCGVREFIGFEIDKTYLTEAKRRIASTKP